GAPAAAALVVPAVPGHDAVEAGAELLQGLAVLDRGAYRLAEVRDQLDAVGAGDHEGVVVFRLPDIRPGLGDNVLLLAEERDLLLERQLAVGDGRHASALH